MPETKSLLLALDEAERAELQRVLEDVLMETRSEDRRTENASFRADLRREEQVLQRLLTKVRELGA